MTLQTRALSTDDEQNTFVAGGMVLLRYPASSPGAVGAGARMNQSASKRATEEIPVEVATLPVHECQRENGHVG